MPWQKGAKRAPNHRARGNSSERKLPPSQETVDLNLDSVKFKGFHDSRTHPKSQCFSPSYYIFRILISHGVKVRNMNYSPKEQDLNHHHFPPVVAFINRSQNSPGYPSHQTRRQNWSNFSESHWQRSIQVGENPGVSQGQNNSQPIRIHCLVVRLSHEGFY